MWRANYGLIMALNHGSGLSGMHNQVVNTRKTKLLRDSKLLRGSMSRGRFI
jgi:hypothetical protein